MAKSHFEMSHYDLIFLFGFDFAKMASLLYL